jgi:ATP-binding cassette subfamily B multidrug efflux pump
MKYLESVLNQESAWFDEINSETLTTKMSTEIKCIQMAISEKFAMMIKAFGMIGVGFGLGFIIGWKFAFVALAMAPIYFVSLMLMGKYMKAGVIKNLQAFNLSGAFAQQALNAIKLVAAFGREQEEHDSFIHHLEAIKAESIKNQFKASFTFALWNGINLMSYAYGFYFGGLFVKK